MDTKSILKSKTFWFNLVAGLVAVAAYVDPELLSALGFSADTQPKILKLVGAAVAAGNVVLRYISTGSVTLPKLNKGSNTPLLIAFVLMLSCSGCAAYNQFTKHCKVTGEYNQTSNGFTACLNCDSVANAVKVLVLKQK